MLINDSTALCERCHSIMSEIAIILNVLLSFVRSCRSSFPFDILYTLGERGAYEMV